MARPTPAGKPRGFIFLALLIVLAAMGATLAAGGTLWHQVQTRDKERELIFAGMQIRNAIALYYNSIPGRQVYPPSLESLLLDERSPAIRRHLRRIYRDPLTNSPQWGLLVAPSGGIMGVYSLAAGSPIKTANFPPALGWTATAEKAAPGSYADWQFVYLPPSAVK